MTEREFAISVVQRLHEAGHEALWAGGCVRDELLGLVPKDYDVATNATPEQVRGLFRRSLAVGASFGVIEVLGPRVEGRYLNVEVATFRTDGAYTDGRRPDHVVFATAQEDAQRRDFTINGMFFDPLKGLLIDYVGGQADLHQRILRAIGDPHLRFQEDKLRLLRAVRLATRFELTIDSATAEAIRGHAAQIRVVSAERIAEELRELLVHPRRSLGVSLLDRLGLIDPLLPELIPLKGLPGTSAGNLWDHVLTLLDYLGPEPSFPLALAGLLHEIGKGRGVAPTLAGHEVIAARLADDVGVRLRLSNQERERAVWLIENQLALVEARTIRTCTLKKLLIHPGIRELLALHRADGLANGQNVEHVDFCEGLLQRWTEEDLNPAPLVKGNDLSGRGLKPGPIFKEILESVRDAQLDGTIRTRDEALELVRQLCVRAAALSP